MSDQEKIQQLLNQAKHAIESGNYREAAKAADEVMQIDHENADAFYLFAFSNPTGNKSDQERNFRKAISINPLHKRAWMELTKIYADPFFKIKNKEEILEMYTKLGELYPNNPEIFKGRGYIYSRSNDHDQAIEDFSKAINLSSRDSNLHIARCRSLLEKQRYSEASVDIDSASRCDPENADILTTMKSAFDKEINFMDLNSAEKIIEKYESYIDFNNPDLDYKIWKIGALARIYEKLGVVSYKHKEYEKAISNLHKSMECSKTLGRLADNHSNVHVWLGKTYNKQGKYKEALVEFEKGSEHPEANEGRAQSLLMLIEEQKKDFQKRLEEFLSGPDSVFKSRDHFLDREKECHAHFRKLSWGIHCSLFITFIIIISEIAGYIVWLHPAESFSIANKPFALLPYFGLVFLSAAIPVWWTRVLLKSRDRWQILREDCFRKATIMQYLKATGGDEQFRNQIIKETIGHMANRSGADLLVALHSDDPGSIFSVAEMFEKFLSKKSGKG